MSDEQLVFWKRLPGGKVLAVHSWPTGYQELVFDSQAAFERAKHSVEVNGAKIVPFGFAPI